MSSKRDDLHGSMAGPGSVSDKLYAQEKAAYSGPLTGPQSLNNYLVGNGKNKNVIQ